MFWGFVVPVLKMVRRTNLGVAGRPSWDLVLPRQQARRDPPRPGAGRLRTSAALDDDRDFAQRDDGHTAALPGASAARYSRWIRTRTAFGGKA